MRPLLALLFCACLLLGCNRVDLAYRHLDVIVPWTLGDYLDLTREQRRMLDDTLHEQLAWHCSTQLPRYREALATLRSDLAAGHSDRLPTHLQRVEQALDALSRQWLQPGVELLRALDDEQVAQLERNLAQRLAEDRETYLSAPLPAQIEQRAERMEERLQRWLGPLDAAQRARVQEWSASLGEQYRWWLDNRSRWQSAFIDALHARQADDFPARLAGLLEHRQQLWDDAYRAAYARSETALLGLFADLLEGLRDTQREHLLERLQRLDAQLARIRCTD